MMIAEGARRAPLATLIVAPQSPYLMTCKKNAPLISQMSRPKILSGLA